MRSIETSLKLTKKLHYSPCQGSSLVDGRDSRDYGPPANKMRRMDRVSGNSLERQYLFVLFLASLL